MSQEEGSDGSSRELPRIEPGALPLHITCECGRHIELWVTTTAPVDNPIKAPGVQVGRASAAAPLTAVEARVLALVAQGHSDQQVAHLLGISVHTAKHALRSSLVRLGARNRTEAVVRALADGQLAEAGTATLGTSASKERSDALDAGARAIQHAGVVGR